jgi:hypothetical protein
LDSWLKDVLSLLFPEFHVRENCSKESLLDAWFLGQKDLEKLVRFENEEGAVHVAVQLASKSDSGLVVCIICDRGDKYLSTNLFNEN